MKFKGSSNAKDYIILIIGIILPFLVATQIIAGKDTNINWYATLKRILQIEMEEFDNTVLGLPQKWLDYINEIKAFQWEWQATNFIETIIQIATYVGNIWKVIFYFAKFGYLAIITMLMGPFNVIKGLFEFVIVIFNPSVLPTITG